MKTEFHLRIYPHDGSWKAVLWRGEQRLFDRYCATKWGARLWARRAAKRYLHNKRMESATYDFTTR